MIYSRGLVFDCQSLGWNNRVDLLQGTGDQKVEGAENFLSEPRIRSPGTGVRGIVISVWVLEIEQGSSAGILTVESSP